LHEFLGGIHVATSTVKLVRCLIIDDDDSPRGLMERLVTRAGHRATGCATPLAGIHAATQMAYDIAIVDMEMPGMNGAVLIGELRRVIPDIRVLVVSGYGDRTHVMAAIEAGADGYILKDEVSESLAHSLQDVRAGNTPLSPRVARLMLSRLRQTLGTKAITGAGTGSHQAIDDPRKDPTPPPQSLAKIKKPD
jgi:DNA-binding NarL/FixJ family response regulator